MTSVSRSLRAEDGAGAWQGTALHLLLAAAAAELLLSRVLSRAGMFMPKTPVMLAGYRLLADAGSIAFTLSLLLALALLAVTLRRRPLAAPAAVLVLAPLAGAAGPGWSLAAAAAMAATLAWLGLGAADSARRTRGPWAAAGLLAVLGAHLSWYVAGAVQVALAQAGRPGSWAGATALTRGGELLAIAAPLLLAVAAGRPRPAGPTRPARPTLWTALLAAIPAAAFAAAFLAQPDLTAVMAIWSLGFTLSWPGVLYGLALAAAGWAVGCLWAAGAEGRRLAAALVLIFVAGFSLQLNQQHLLVLLAYTMLGPASGPREAATWPTATM